MNLNLVQLAHDMGREFTASITREDQKLAGQFMTPPNIATFMAKRLVAGVEHQQIRLLEPSAGAGILAAAVIQALLEKATPPTSIELMLFEQDARLADLLTTFCRSAAATCNAAGIEFDFLVCNEDFLTSELATKGEQVDGLLTIANPPFFKLNKTTDERAKLHSYAVYGQPNVYGLFMAATARITPSNGRWCFITPRSWMNGQYFKAVRRTMMTHLAVDSLHAFESRTDSFAEDAVLQETAIVWASGRALRDPGLNVMFTQSKGTGDLDSSRVQKFPSERIITSDEHAMVTLPTDGDEVFKAWTATLDTYGLKVSTGPVIAFRNREHICAEARADTVPLLWLQHVSQQKVNWPISKKVEHVKASAETAWMLLPNEPMVIMRRFSPKEDIRRVTCSPYLGQLPGSVIGLENHLNYIHRPGGRMTIDEVRGLSAFLASKVADPIFRGQAGSTQINAGELRRIPLPPLELIEDIGHSLGPNPTLDQIDKAVAITLALNAAICSTA